MRLVTKDCAVLQDLPEQSAKALRASWGHKTQAPPAQAILRQAVALQAWIQCDCLDDASAAKAGLPLLVPHHRRDGSYHVQRSPLHGEHAESCNFHWTERELRHRADARSSCTSDALAGERFLLLTRERAQAARGVSSHRNSGANASVAQALRERLYWLLELAKVNHFHGLTSAELETIEAKQKDGKANDPGMGLLLNTCKEVPFYGHLTLAQIVWQRFVWITEGLATQDLTRYAADQWPTHFAVQGFFILRASEINGTRIVCEEPFEDSVRTLAIEVEHPVYFAPGASTHDAPFVIIVCARLDRAKGGYLRFEYAYAQPRYSHKSGIDQWSLCPVANARERERLSKLLYVRWLCTQDNTRLSIEHTMPRLAPGQASRPEFLLDAVTDTGHAHRLCVHDFGGPRDATKRQTEQVRGDWSDFGMLIDEYRTGEDERRENKRLMGRLCSELRAQGLLKPRHRRGPDQNHETRSTH